ncbi:MAG: glycosyltransferase [Woeseiaceae bacterium]|nr:glycosyltransferase [Woeseiaceae bacterium]
MNPRTLEEVEVDTRDIGKFLDVHSEERVTEIQGRAEGLRAVVNDHTIWNVNSTAVGGGVAEMLQPMLAFSRGLGLDARWLVITGPNEFFQLTKRIHHALHGQSGDGSPLGAAERDIYELTMRENADDLMSRVKPGDFVILHDPQTAGLAPLLMDAGLHVIWRCHIGYDRRNSESDLGWNFLRPYIEHVPALIFSKRRYAPTWCDPERVVKIQPSIDAFSAKNQFLESDSAKAILVQADLVAGEPPDEGTASFRYIDGSEGRVQRQAVVDRAGEPPPQDAPLVVQVSRWDPLKDMMGVMMGFVKMLERSPEIGAHLVLAGPNVHAVADDPEAPQVYKEVLAKWQALPDAVRERVHLANLPVDDVTENAIIVNALQRHAAIVVQKSFKEGFGLTVTEAMWKGRAVVASAVGGIIEQIDDGVDGCLLEDPADLDGFADILERLLKDDELRESIGRAAREKVRVQFLGIRHLTDYANLIEQLLERSLAD